MKVTEWNFKIAHIRIILIQRGYYDPNDGDDKYNEICKLTGESKEVIEQFLSGESPKNLLLLIRLQKLLKINML